MLPKFKINDYFIYRYNDTWMVCKITELVVMISYDESYINYYRYTVVKKCNTDNLECSRIESVGSTSLFGHNSSFHRRCTIIKSIDDDALLSIVL